VLRRHLADVPGVTRTRVQAWIEAGHVAVNGTPVRRVATRTPAGSVVTIQGLGAGGSELQEEGPKAGGSGLGRFGPEPRAWSLEPSEILYEDEHLLAVAKPAGIVVHPTYRHAAGTLLDAVRAYGREWPASKRPSVVGRLDKLTSGVVIVAKGADVHAKLQRAMATAEKDYLAVVHGRVKVARGQIDLKLGRDPHDRRRVVASTTDGAASLTRFERLARGHGASLLRCRLVTGRMHQIRVHLAARGWPVVGDPKYGDGRTPGATGATGDTDAEAIRAFPRQALHAWRTVFAHPAGGARVAVEAPVPADLEALLARILGPCWSDALPPLSSRSVS